MENRVEIFKNEQFGEIRTVVIDDEPWFVAVDVCKALELSNPTVATGRLDNDERAKFNLGRQGETTIVNEPGLYSLVLGSRKPEAKEFKRWITHEVIPSIRKHGAYMTPDTIEKVLANPDLIIGLATQLKEARLEAEKEREAKNIALTQVEEAKPKVVFADAVASSETTILVGELAKLLKQNGVNIGQNRLFEWLRENGYLIKRGSSYNMPTQKSMELGLFEIKEHTIANPDGSIRVTKTTKVTGYGQQYFVNLFLNKYIA